MQYLAFAEYKAGRQSKVIFYNTAQTLVRGERRKLNFLPPGGSHTTETLLPSLHPRTQLWAGELTDLPQW